MTDTIETNAGSAAGRPWLRLVVPVAGGVAAVAAALGAAQMIGGTPRAVDCSAGRVGATLGSGRLLDLARACAARGRDDTQARAGALAASRAASVIPGPRQAEARRLLATLKTGPASGANRGANPGYGGGSDLAAAAATSGRLGVELVAQPILADTALTETRR